MGMLRRIPLAALAALTAACTGSAGTPEPQPASPAPVQRPAVTNETYVAFATLERSVEDGSTVACPYASLLMIGETCGGGGSLPIAGVPDEFVPPADAGRSAPPTLKLVGTWDGHTLHVISARRTGHHSDQAPTCASGRPQRWQHLRRAVTADPSLNLIEFGPCGRHSVQMRVLALDRTLRAHIHENYGDLVHVHGWMVSTDLRQSP
jgi:hypothetical protein